LDLGLSILAVQLQLLFLGEGPKPPTGHRHQVKHLRLS